jgi:glyoxylase-like metal-dependent hydrolase (beta-lactamase superfamily II)
VDRGLVDREVIMTAGLRIEVLHTPGHARDHLAFLVDRKHCFTGDVLFRGTVGGTLGPGRQRPRRTAAISRHCPSAPAAYHASSRPR